MRLPLLLLTLLLFPLIFLLSAIGPGSAADSPPLPGWYDNAAGYQQALDEHQRTGKPLLVYFYAPWCPYCQRFDRQLLLSPSVIQHLRGFIKVRVYPQVGAEERRIANDFGNQSYPEVFLKRAGKPFAPLEIYTPSGDDWVLYTPGQFVRALK